MPLLLFKVQSSAISHSFWTSACLPSASKSNPPLFLAPFGLPPASPPHQRPILRSFWTSSCLPSASKSNPPLFLTPFGLSPASPPHQRPILRSFSLLLDFLLSPLCFKVQSSSPSRSFWTFSCLPSTSKSIPPLFFAPFGLPPASSPLQSPILRYFSLLLDFLASPRYLKVQSAALPRPTTQKRRIAKQSASRNPAILIRQSNSTISMPVISQFHQVKHLQ